MSDERRPVCPWILSLLIGLPVLYVASFGPACWLSKPREQKFVTIESWNFSYASYRSPPRFYWPLGWLILNGPKPIHVGLMWYARFGLDEIGPPLYLPAHWDET
jgi:hypothetical protein